MSFLHKVCLLAKKHNPEAMVLAKTVGDFLGDKGVKVFYLEKDADYSLQPELNQIDLFLVFGGDGTMINAARHLAGTNIPLAGINLGRVGFLLELTRANWQAALTKALEQGFERDERMLISSELVRDGEVFERSVAANEFVISRGGIARLIAMELSVAYKKILYVRADGLIVYTPTGSTAYANSAGGPILYPALNAYGIIAVCPFLTGVQPLVLDAQTVLTIKIIEVSSNTCLSGDGQAVIKLQSGDIIRIQGMPCGLTFANFGLHGFFDKLQATGLVRDSLGLAQF